jgi:hypothetical protein
MEGSVLSFLRAESKQKQEWPVVAMFVSASELNEQSS